MAPHAIDLDDDEDDDDEDDAPRRPSLLAGGRSSGPRPVAAATTGAREKVIRAIKGGAHDRASIAKSAGIEIGRATYYLQALVHEGGVEATGNRKSRRYFMPGSTPAAGSRTTLEVVVAKPRTKKVPPKKAAPAKKPKPVKVTGATDDHTEIVERLVTRRDRLQVQVDALTAAIEALS